MKRLFGVVVALGISSSAFAAGYGTAGCGLGSMLFGNQKGMVQVLAATTNGISGNQTFGISSGTSNCASGGKTATQFIEVNQAALTNDAAKGEGEAISALSEIYGCTDAAKFQETVKNNFGTIFSNKKATEIHSRMRNVIKTNKLSCNV